MHVLLADKFEQSGQDGLKAASCEVTYQPGLKDDALAEAVERLRPDVRGNLSQKQFFSSRLC
jgi:hypothetical protein